MQLIVDVFMHTVFCILSFTSELELFHIFCTFGFNQESFMLIQASEICNTSQVFVLKMSRNLAHCSCATTVPALLLLHSMIEELTLSLCSPKPNVIFLFQICPCSWISSCSSTTVGAATDWSLSSWDGRTNTLTPSQKTQWTASWPTCSLWRYNCCTCLC